METLSNSTGLSCEFTGDFQKMWRPWVGTDDLSPKNKSPMMLHNYSEEKQPKAPQVVHPVKLFWPKSKCFDYLYQDAEMLLRNYPVQATICPFLDSSSDEESDDEEDDEEEMMTMMEKEMN